MAQVPSSCLRAKRLSATATRAPPLQSPPLQVFQRIAALEHRVAVLHKGEAAAQQVLQCSSNGAQEEKIKSRIPTAAAMDRDETKMRGKQRFEANRVASVMLCKCKCTCK